MTFLYVIAVIILYIPFVILFPTRALGKKRRIKGKKIITCNHLSLVDPLVLAAHTRGQIYFMGKKEFCQANFFTRFLSWGLGVVSVDRGKPDLTAIKRILALLKRNKTVGLFPEGTRNKTGQDLQKILGGSVMFALKGDAPVSPMILLRKPKILRPNVLIIGDPVDLDRFRNQKLTSEVLEQAAAELESSLKRLQKLVRYYASLKGKEKRNFRKLYNNPTVKVDDIYRSIFPEDKV